MKLISAVLLASLIVTGCGGGDDDGENMGAYRCSDFSTQRAAQEALRRGATQLDSDRDGIACENLPA
jgi:hypothetical protein